MSSATDNHSRALSFVDISPKGSDTSAGAAQSTSSPQMFDDMYRTLQSFWTDRRPNWWTSGRQLDNSKLNESYLSTYGSLNMP